MSLLPCPGCARHLQSTAVACPFCGVQLRPASTARRSGLLLATGVLAGAVAVGCGGSSPTSPEPTAPTAEVPPAPPEGENPPDDEDDAPPAEADPPEADPPETDPPEAVQPEPPEEERVRPMYGMPAPGPPKKPTP